MHTRRTMLASIAIGCTVEALCTNGASGADYELIQEVVGVGSIRPVR